MQLGRAVRGGAALSSRGLMLGRLLPAASAEDVAAGVRFLGGLPSFLRLPASVERAEASVPGTWPLP